MATTNANTNLEEEVNAQQKRIEQLEVEVSEAELKVQD